jgi:hypothetical protein
MLHLALHAPDMVRGHSATRLYIAESPVFARPNPRIDEQPGSMDAMRPQTESSIYQSPLHTKAAEQDRGGFTRCAMQIP